MTRGESFHLLVVCTANQCRSPVAAALADVLLQGRDINAEVVSAGFLEGGAPAIDGAIRTMAHRGLDISAHRSRRLDIEMITAASLILTMERRHIIGIAQLSLAAVERTFTIHELARLARTVGPRHSPEVIESWISRASQLRDPSSTLSATNEDDVADPTGSTGRAFRRAADQIEQLLTVLVDALFPALGDPGH